MVTAVVLSHCGELTLGERGSGVETMVTAVVLSHCGELTLGERGSGWPQGSRQKSEGRVHVVGMETMVTAAVCTVTAGS